VSCCWFKFKIIFRHSPATPLTSKQNALQCVCILNLEIAFRWLVIRVAGFGRRPSRRQDEVKSRFERAKFNLWKVIFDRLVDYKFLLLYETQKFISVFSNPCKWILSWSQWIEILLLKHFIHCLLHRCDTCLTAHLPFLGVQKIFLILILHPQVWRFEWRVLVNKSGHLQMQPHNPEVITDYSVFLTAMR
jgi:hypothetical protein